MALKYLMICQTCYDPTDCKSVVQYLVSVTSQSTFLFANLFVVLRIILLLANQTVILSCGCSTCLVEHYIFFSV